MKVTQKTISTDATVYNADGFEIRTGVTVIKHTDEEGEYLIIGRSLHAMSDIIEDGDGRFTLCCIGGTLVL